MLLLALAGCGGPVELATPELSTADAERCAALVADLPETLAEQPRVESEPDDAPGAAFGDPAIVLSCGVAEPDGFGPGASCEVADGVRWYLPEEQYGDEPRALTLTAAWDTPRLQVTVPATYWPQGGAAVMAALAPLVQEHLRRLPGSCL